VDFDALSEAQLERLHAGLLRLATMDEAVLAGLVEHVLAGDDLGPADNGSLGKAGRGYGTTPGAPGPIRPRT
jgi:hypothetical protein